MASILPCVQQHAVFEPEVTQAMAIALEDVCRELKILPEHVVAREIIATRIIDLARTGDIDAQAIRDRLLLEAKSAADVF
jgi:hypothetical protein